MVLEGGVGDFETEEGGDEHPGVWSKGRMQ